MNSVQYVISSKWIYLSSYLSKAISGISNHREKAGALGNCTLAGTVYLEQNGSKKKRKSSQFLLSFFLTTNDRQSRFILVANSH
jgi:hypothetical protein